MIATTQLGKHGPASTRIGLGAMGLSGTYGPAQDDEGRATIQAALDAGINLIDTGDFYGMGHNELRLSEDQLAELERAVPAHEIAGARYAEAQMAHLDSER